MGEAMGDIGGAVEGAMGQPGEPGMMGEAMGEPPLGDGAPAGEPK